MTRKMVFNSQSEIIVNRQQTTVKCLVNIDFYLTLLPYIVLLGRKTELFIFVSQIIPINGGKVEGSPSQYIPSLPPYQ